MISDEFETFGNNCFWRGQTKTKIFIQKIFQFIKIQNIHLKQIFIFKNLEYSFKTNIPFLKSRIIIQKNIPFIKFRIFTKKKRGRMSQGLVRASGWN